MALDRDGVRRAVYRALGEPVDEQVAVGVSRFMARCLERVCRDNRLVVAIADVVEQLVSVLVFATSRVFRGVSIYRVGNAACIGIDRCLTYLSAASLCIGVSSIAPVIMVGATRSRSDDNAPDPAPCGEVVVPCSTGSISGVFSYTPVMVTVPTHAIEAEPGDIVVYGYWSPRGITYVAHPVVAELHMPCIRERRGKFIVTAAVTRTEIQIDTALPMCTPVRIVRKIITPEDPEYRAIMRVVSTQ